MKYLLRLVSVIGFMVFSTTPVMAGGICQDDSVCTIWMTTLIIVIRYGLIFLIIAATSFIIIKFTSKSFSIKKNILISTSIALVLIIFYHMYLSVWIQKYQIESSDKEQLNQVEYRLYDPSFLPDGYELREARFQGDKNYMYFKYGKENINFSLSEFEKPTTMSFNPPSCIVRGENFEFRDDTSSMWMSEIQNDCNEIKTPKGISIYLMNYQVSENYPNRNYALFVLDDTLITITRYDFSELELISLVDGLQEISPDEIEILVSERNIGR